jgi:formyltetrahydrofolate-dependent phosphoribosylglycinamide formyltransferase
MPPKSTSKTPLKSRGSKTLLSSKPQQLLLEQKLAKAEADAKGPPPLPSGVMDLAQARKLRDELAKQGKKLVLTNGCFDLLHAGHVRYLKQARALGDALVVALNSDASVRELKGPTRPLNREKDRAEVMASLRAVDAVIVFPEKRATQVIKALCPHVYAKGGDYTPDSLDPEEKAALAHAKTEIQILSLVQGRSTTKIIERMTQAESQGARRPLRIAVLGSGAGSNFKAILDAIADGALDAEICAAVSDVEDSGFLKMAQEAKLPAFHVDAGPHPRRFPAELQEDMARQMQTLNPDVIVLAGFMRILKAPLLNCFPDRIINVHPSLLPKYKGANAVQDALDDGEIETGCSVHLVNSEIDGGRVLAQARVPIKIGDTVATLHERIKTAEHHLLPHVLSNWVVTQ